MHQFCSYAASLSIGLQIDIEVGITVESSLRHRLFDDISHLKEATLTFAEAGIHYLVGSIHDTRHITTLSDGIESQLQTLELLIVRLEELQILRLEEVETIAIQMQTGKRRHTG